MHSTHGTDEAGAIEPGFGGWARRWAGRRWKPWHTDLLLACFALTFGMVELCSTNPLSYWAKFDLPDCWPFLLKAAMAALLMLRRRWTLGVTAAAIGADLLLSTPIVLAVAMYGLGVVPRLRVHRICVAVLAITSHAFALHFLFVVGDSRAVVYSAATVGGPFVMGLYVRTRHQVAAHFAERALRLERERQLLDRQVRMRERNRIAGEIHDMVGHRVVHIVMAAEMMERRTATNPDPVWVRSEAVRIGEIGRQAMEELRASVAALRGPDDLADELLLPEAMVTELPRLVEHNRAAGADITLTMACDPDEIPDTVQRAVYRIVQEALTNAHRHAHGSPIAISIRKGVGDLRVWVRTAPVQPAGRPELPRGGHGLVGLEERVAALGGTFRAGPDDNGGFIVSAGLPVPAGITLCR